MSVEVKLIHAAKTILPTGLIRLGGEGRLAHLTHCKPGLWPEAPKATAQTQGLILVLTSCAYFKSNDGKHPRYCRHEI